MQSPELIESAERVVDFECALELCLVLMEIGFVESDEGDIFVLGGDGDFSVSASVDFERLKLRLLSESAVRAGSPAGVLPRSL